MRTFTKTSGALTSKLMWSNLVCVCLLGCGSPDALPHIVLITVDALRADHLSLNGYPRVSSPALDAFATTAWNFPNAVAVIPKTGPSMATLFTGLHPAQHGVRHNRQAVPARTPMLAEILRSAGYRTAAFVSNPVLWKKWGYQRGFDVYRQISSDDGVRKLNSAFASWAGDPWKQPTFVWLHYIDPHGPYDPPPEFAGHFADDALMRGDLRAAIRYTPLDGYNSNKILGAIPAYQLRGQEDRVAAYVRLYDAEIRYVDHAISEVLELLLQRGAFDPSAIVVTADHGESLGEHDYYFEHGWFAYDATLRVPLLIKLPGQSQGGLRSEQVSTLDLFPSLLALAGIEPPDGVIGRNLLAPPREGRAVVVENSGRYPESYIGLRTRSRKYLRELSTGREELYYIDEDPAETSNRAAEDPAGVARARAQLAELQATMQSQVDPEL